MSPAWAGGWRGGWGCFSCAPQRGGRRRARLGRERGEGKEYGGVKGRDKGGKEGGREGGRREEREGVCTELQGQAGEGGREGGKGLPALWESRPLVGSSRKRQLGLLISSIATPTRRFSPPEMPRWVEECWSPPRQEKGREEGREEGRELARARAKP